MRGGAIASWMSASARTRISAVSPAPDRWVASQSGLLLYWLGHATLLLDPDGHRDKRYRLRNNVEKVLLHV
jgi:hypothetical protein